MLGFTDLLVDDDGDILISAKGDLDLADSRRTVAQDIMFRVRTQLGDFRPHPALGSDAASMIGRVNNAENGAKLQEMVNRALTIDGRLAPGEFSVKILPVSKERVVVVIMVDAVFPDVEDFDPLVITFSFNYTSGTIELISGPLQSGSGALP